ncbi:MAG: hypothetical protein ACUVV4_07360 [Candidatus Bathyarchaeia archaeon]
MRREVSKSNLEIWELKGLDRFGNLVFLQEVKMDKTGLDGYDYILDSIFAAISKGSIKVVLEKLVK